MSRNWRSSAMKIRRPSAGLRERADGEAGEQERRNRGAALTRGETVEHGRGRKRAEEGGDRQRCERQRDRRCRQQPIADHDGEGGRERRAAGDADQARLGQRIAEQPLHDGAGRREHRADHAGHGDARQPDRPQHEPVALDRAGSPSTSPKRRQQPLQRNAGRADRGGDHRGQQPARCTGARNDDHAANAAPSSRSPATCLRASAGATAVIPGTARRARRRVRRGASRP